MAITMITMKVFPDSKVNGADMGPTWVLSAPDGPHVGPINFASVFFFISDMLIILIVAVAVIVALAIIVFGILFVLIIKR